MDSSLDLISCHISFISWKTTTENASCFPGLNWGASIAQQRSPQVRPQIPFGLRYFAPIQLGFLMGLAPSEGILERGRWPLQLLEPLSQSQQLVSPWAERGSGRFMLWTLCTDRPGFKSGSATFWRSMISHILQPFNPHFLICEWNRNISSFLGGCEDERRN